MSKSNDRLDREFRHNLRRCPKLSDAEIRFLALLGSFRHGCLLNYDEICLLTNWSRPKLKRVITSLKKYALIEIEYRAYKKTTIKIAAAEVQTRFAELHDGSPVSHQSWLTHEPMMAHPRAHDGSPVSHSMLERELERKLERALPPEIEKQDNFYDAEKVSNLIKAAFPKFGKKQF